MALNLLFTMVTCDIDNDMINDTATVYFDDNTLFDEIKVSLDGGQTIIQGGNDCSDFVGVVYSPFEFCNGATRTRFQRIAQFPYAIKVEEAESPTCLPATCDLDVTTPIAFTDETGVGLEDGTITITATASGTIEYSINDGGTFQASNSFTALAPGNYDVIVKDVDKENLGVTCRQSFVVTIAEFFSYVEKYSLTFKNVKETTTWGIKIFKKNYVGAVIEYCASSDPLVLTMHKGAGDQIQSEKFNQIKGSSAQITLIQNTDFEYSEFFTSDDREFQVEVTKDAVLYWKGYSLPDRFTQNYRINAKNVVQIEASDGLALLKNEDFKNTDGSLIKEFKSKLEAIRICLDKLDLGLPIFEAFNVYELSHNSTNNDSPYDQTFVNTEAYITDEEAMETLNCYEVLQKILFGARIFQSEGAWHIVRIKEQEAAYVRRKYTSLGVFISSETFNPIVDVECPVVNGRFVLDNSGSISIKPAFKSQSIKQDFGFIDNLVFHGDFPESEFEETGVNIFEPLNWFGTATSRRRYNGSNEDDFSLAIQTIGDVFNIQNAKFLESQPFNVDTTFSRIIFSFKYKTRGSGADPSTVQRVFIQVKIGSNYLMEDGEWSLTEYKMGFPVKASGTFETFEIESFNMPVTSGTGVVRIFEGISTLAQYLIFETFFDNISIEWMPDNRPAQRTEILTQTSNNETATFIPDTLDVIHGDAPVSDNAKNIYKNILFLSDQSATMEWFRKGVAEARPFLDIILQDILLLHNIPTELYTIEIARDLNFTNVIQDQANNNKLFMINSLSINAKKGVSQGEFLALLQQTEEDLAENAMLYENSYIMPYENGDIMIYE